MSWWRTVLETPSPHSGKNSKTTLRSWGWKFSTKTPSFSGLSITITCLHRSWLCWKAALRAGWRRNMGPWEQPSQNGTSRRNATRKAKVGQVFCRIGPLIKKPQSPRSRDTARFLVEVQREYFTAMRDFLREETGFQAAICGSNWRTGRLNGLSTAESSPCGLRGPKASPGIWPAPARSSCPTLPSNRRCLLGSSGLWPWMENRWPNPRKCSGKS